MSHFTMSLSPSHMDYVVFSGAFESIPRFSLHLESLRAPDFPTWHWIILTIIQRQPSPHFLSIASLPLHMGSSFLMGLWH